MREPYIGQPVTRVKINRAVRVPASPELLEHLEFLVSIGMNNYMIARAAGVTSTTVRNLRFGDATGSTADVHRALLAVTPRPSKHQACVLSFAAVRRLEGLAYVGWTTTAIGDHMGVDRTWARGVRTRKAITWSSHCAIDAAFQELSHLDGGNARTKAWARRSGFVHPFMWDDIDDYYEVPSTPEDSGLPDPVVVERLMAGHSTNATREERKAAFFMLRESGMSVNAAADMAHISPRTAERYLNSLKGVAA